MADKINTYVVTYDVSLNKPRNRLVKILEGFGKRFQYSVFLCEMNRERADELFDKLVSFMIWKEKWETLDFETAMKSANDSVAVFQLCGSCLGRIKYYGREAESNEKDVVI